EVEPEQLYLVGDFFDGWRLKRRWYWNRTYTRILARLIELSKMGVKIYYAPGNHDEFMRDFLCDLRLVEVCDEFVHTTADGRRFLVLHGDQFDGVIRKARWLSLLGDVGYNLLMGFDGRLNAVRRAMGLSYYCFSGAVKRSVKRVTSAVCDFENALVRAARGRDCDGVVCGHIHTPVVSNLDGITYCNTGDWVENCTALVEYADGRLELLRRPVW
ncbi:MAG: UDP-2,3-diacylglucosamine diphosphatase, partial [Planctomycetia bacterium]